MVDYNKIAFAPPGCKIIVHEKPVKRRTWAPHGQHGYSLGPAMHRYRCQNLYISSTASERIVDTLEFFPHNSPMPQLSSTYRLIMAANNMTNALKHPHPEVTFAHVKDDTKNSINTAGGDFKKQISKTQVTRTHSFAYQGRRKQKTFCFNTANSNFSHAASVSNKVTQTNPHDSNNRHAITSEGDHTNDGSGSISEGATALTKSFSKKFVTRSFLERTETANMAIALGKNHWSQQHFANTVVHPVTGKQR
jgi:hypothetical protein